MINMHYQGSRLFNIKYNYYLGSFTNNPVMKSIASLDIPSYNSSGKSKLT